MGFPLPFTLLYPHFGRRHQERNQVFPHQWVGIDAAPLVPSLHLYEKRRHGRLFDLVVPVEEDGDGDIDTFLMVVANDCRTPQKAHGHASGRHSSAISSFDKAREQLHFEMQFGEWGGGFRDVIRSMVQDRSMKSAGKKGRQKRNEAATNAEIGATHWHIFLLANDGVYVCPPEEEAHDHLTLLIKVDQAFVKFVPQVIDHAEIPVNLHVVVQLTVCRLRNE